ncbi:MAG TPA: hypothetical protein VEK37_01330 [Gemmatimonadaceae bacterium]|nr:hypothetical protein [Gemmatimonadaceae bacterium]
MPEEATSFHRSELSGMSVRANSASAELPRSPYALGRPVPPEALCEELHLAVERAAAKSVDSMNALRLAVRRFTIALRADGASPEAVLIAIKSVIHTRTFLLEPLWSREEIGQQISTWSVREFFSEKQA